MFVGFANTLINADLVGRLRRPLPLIYADNFYLRLSASGYEATANLRLSAYILRSKILVTLIDLLFLLFLGLDKIFLLC